ncbi:MAG TPA: hypothetical protein VNA20_08000 [Frankiaceae bacterium]|nr:hypothetical protein [Frankiaceae bacterium]
MRRPGRRWRQALLALAPLLLPACEHTAAEQATERLVAAARVRNTAVGAALVVLLVVAARLLAFVLGRERTRRGAPPLARLPVLLVVSMVATQVTALLLLAFTGGGVGYFVGPTPEPTSLDDFGTALTAIVLAPFGVFAVAAACAFFVTVGRLPQVETATFGIATFGHLLCAVGGAVFGGYSEPAAWSVAGWVLAAVSLVAAAGYAYGLSVRVRVARTRRAAGRAAPR